MRPNLADHNVDAQLRQFLFLPPQSNVMFELDVDQNEQKSDGNTDIHNGNSAPGETEHAVTVEALNFSCCGSFGVRIVGDGSCQIGENDRTIVHISGEKSEPRETEPEETAPAAALFAARPNAALFASVGEEVWDGVLGSKFYRVKDLNMWLSSVGYDWTHQLRTEDRKTIKLGEEVIVESGGSESLKINLDLGTVNANVENISLDIKTKQGFCSAISNADRSMKGS